MIKTKILFSVFNFNYIISLIPIFFLIHLGYLKLQVSLISYHNYLYNINSALQIVYIYIFFFFLLRKKDSNTITQNRDNLFEHLTQPKGYIIHYIERHFYWNLSHVNFASTCYLFKHSNNKTFELIRRFVFSKFLLSRELFCKPTKK